MKRLIRKAKVHTMYHSTAYEIAKTILEDGFIKPVSETGVINPLTYSLQKDVVYLSEYRGEAWHSNTKGIVCFEIMIDDEVDNLGADEDGIDVEGFTQRFYEECEARGIELEPELKQEWFAKRDFYVELKKLLNNPTYEEITTKLLKEFSFKDSIRNMGSVAFIGSIPIDRISKMYVETQETSIITLDELLRIGKELGWEE